ncbi:transmembrane 53 [Micractinium conductrix]|uniref:Transmembrane 53 n=1 Tax=Micractinium conductrix TaxID=554055 RepID=A0A2P6VD75_9CHLO|nr:transmembrane 53 [Micractinium conductrix]|eukprot:PSC72029.1 transmembrane 53 [Micractinium conductrix]
MSRRAFREAPRPVVLLLGWLGSKAQNLSKYQKMYQDLGAQVISHQPSIMETAYPAAADRAILNFMKDFNYRYSVLCSMRGEAPPVLVHAMSNAGFIAYGTMLHLASLLRPQPLAPPLTPAAGAGAGGTFEFDPSAWRAAGSGARLTASPASPADRSYRLWGASASASASASGGEAGPHKRQHPLLWDPSSLAVLSAFRQVLRNTQGIVVDSAPSQATVNVWSLGLLSAVLSQPAQSVPEAHPHLLRLARRATERYLSLPPVMQRIREVRHAWQHSVPPCPQLYLYSKADALIPYQHIERFMDQQAAHSTSVLHHCWADSPHCEHLRRHPEQYRSIVRSFMEHCLHSGQTSPESWI